MPSSRAPASCCSPLEERFGETWFPDGCLAAPAATFKLSVSLTTDHDQVEFLGTDPAGLHSPQVDHQLAADGHDGLFLQRPVGAAQDFLPFLHRLVLGLKEDNPPDRLGDNPSNGRYAHLGNGPQPLVVSGAPFAGASSCTESPPPPQSDPEFRVFLD